MLGYEEKCSSIVELFLVYTKYMVCVLVSEKKLVELFSLYDRNRLVFRYAKKVDI